MKSTLALLQICHLVTSFSLEAFDPREATISSIHNALFSRSFSCRDIISSHLSQISNYNPSINTIISLNPHALSQADALDLQLASGNSTGALLCVPVLLEDNFDAEGLNTTGGCLALAGNRAREDAPTVRALKNAGAIILGKTNIYELALKGLSVSSLGGQTLNPYNHTRTPGGSSGGTGAAIAASFAIIRTGTDTMNSLRSPTIANSLFSVRPTRGLISSAGVIPVSYTQDAVGPIARTVSDLAIALSVMASAGQDGRDNTTSLRRKLHMSHDYEKCLYGGSLQGMRIGLLRGFFNHTFSAETTPVNDVMETMVSILERAGASVVSIKDFVYNVTTIASFDAQTFEFREAVDTYLQTAAIEDISSFGDIYRSGKFLITPNQYDFIQSAAKSSTKKSGSQIGVPIAVWPKWYPRSIPVVNVPAGFSPPTEHAPIGVPVGMEILGLPWTEHRILNTAAHISSSINVRGVPSFANGTLKVSAYEAVPSIFPNTFNIPSAYLLGTLGD